MFVSVIVPVYNGGETLRACLEAIHNSRYEHWECIVVDDGSTDGSVAIAHRFGARVLTNFPHRSGPARARNLGAQVARGELLFFVDADVLVTPGTMGHAVALMLADSDVVACFGSYDDNPAAKNFLSQYRNLLHHYVHQNSQVEASTFWSGCGMIRRDLFWEMGGFDTTTFSRPSIEDVELGYRLRAAGYQIRLEKLLQVQHLKRWTMHNMVKTDVLDRALPWTRLILAAGNLPDDLNLQTTHRVSTAVSYLGLVALLAAPLHSAALLVFLLAGALLLRLNRDFYAFLNKKRGMWFTMRSLPWHWFYYIYSGAAFVAGVVWYGLLQRDRIFTDEPSPVTASGHSSSPLGPPFN